MNNKKKQSYGSLKDQQKYCNYIQMAEYNKVNVEVTDTHLKKLKTSVKNNAGTTLRMSLKMFDENDL